MILRTLVLLGGSRQQVVAIEAAKACGYRTVLCDYLPDNPGQYHADAFYQVSTTDREAVLEVACAEQAEGIIAYSSDPAAPTAAFVAEAIGLPANPLSSVEILSEKHLFRQYLREQGFPCPQAFSFSVDVPFGQVALQAAALNYPLVVKPTDSSGSKGVHVVKKQSELSQAIEYASKFSRNGILICEEFIERGFPNVIGGDVFVRDGKVKFWGLMSCLRDERQSLVPIGKSIPLELDADRYERVQDVLQRLIDSLGILFGEFNVEIILGTDGVPYILELGSRAGGNMIPVQLSDASGIDLVRANVMCAMGDDPGALAWDARHDATHAYLSYVLHSLEDGIFEGIELSKEAAQHCYRQVIYQDVGSPVFRFTGADKALGILFFRFDNAGQLDTFVDEIEVQVSIDLTRAV